MNVFIRCSFIKERDYKTICNFAGEVERLLREYTQNQEMVRNIGSHYYQIIYPYNYASTRRWGSPLGR
jgi:hypothetical protein